MKQASIQARNLLLACSLSLACTMPAMAQSTTGGGAGTGTTGATGATSTQTVADNTNREEDRDYGWIGLLGLAGLLGLRRKRDDHIATRTSSGTAR